MSDEAIVAALAESAVPALRVRADGQVVWANRAARPLLERWGADVRYAGAEGSGVLPGSWAARFAQIVASGAPAELSLPGGSLRVQPEEDRRHALALGCAVPGLDVAALHPDPVLRLDQEGVVLSVNEAASTLLTTWRIDVGDAVPADLRQRIRSVAAEGHPRAVSVEIEGRPPLELHLAPSGDSVLAFARGSRPEGGHEIGSAILANMSHELRTPLNAIIGYSELLGDELRDLGHDELLADVAKISSSAENLRRMIADLLEVARVEAGRSPLQLDRFELADLVEDLALSIAPLLQDNHNDLDVRIDHGETDMVGDAAKVRRILGVLLENAAKFTKNGRVTLEVHPGLDEVSLVVSDTGIGMDAEQLAQLFRPFQQADRSARRRFGGTGLGLALVRLLTEQMGGTIAVRSEPDRGSTFTVTLPNVPRTLS